jgi:hypothetical protein
MKLEGITALHKGEVFAIGLKPVTWPGRANLMGDILQH